MMHSQTNSLAILFLLPLLHGFAGAQEPNSPATVRIEVRSGLQGSFHENVGFEVLPTNQGPFAEPYLEGVTDDEGKAFFVIEASSPREVRQNWLVRVKQSGKARRVGYWKNELRPSKTGPLRCDLWVEEGQTRFLMAVGSDGSPVQAKWVARVEGGERWQNPSHSWEGKAYGGGWTAVHWPTGRPVDVAAYVLGQGAALARGVVASADEPVVLTLRSKGSLKGRALRPNGEPEQGLRLFVRRKGSLRTLGSMGGVLATPDDGLHIEGLEVGLAETDHLGRFVVTGLAPGEYELFPCPDKDGEEVDFDVPWKVLATSAEEHVVTLLLPRLEVDLLDELGEPWSSRKHKQAEWPGFGWGRDTFPFQSWPKEPQVLVRWLPSGRASSPVPWSFLKARQAMRSDGKPLSRFFVNAKAGSFYSVQVVGGPFRGEVQVVQVPADSMPARVKLRAPREASIGTLQLECRRNGAIINLSSHREGYGIWIADWETGLPLVAQGSVKPIATTLRLPAGKYRAILEGRPIVDGHHGYLMSPRTTGRVEAVVEVFPGEEAKVVLDVQQGGYLNLVIEAAPSKADQVAAREKYYWAESNAEWLESASRNARVVLRKPNTQDESVLWSGPAMGGTTAAGIHLLSDWPFGARHKTEMLPAGSYEIVASTLSGRTATQRIEIRSGHVLNLELSIE